MAVIGGGTAEAADCPNCGEPRRQMMVTPSAGPAYLHIEHVNQLAGVACPGPDLSRLPLDPVSAEADIVAKYEAQRDAARPVAAAAREALGRMQSDHAGAPLLKAIAQRLCQDIDETERVGERIAATRQVVALLQVLDGALFPGSHHAPPGGPGDDEAPEPAGDTDDDDPFKIGDVPPGVGDSPA